MSFEGEALNQGAGGSPPPAGADYGTESGQQTETGVASPSEPGGVNTGGQRPSDGVPHDRFNGVNNELQAAKRAAVAAGYGSLDEAIQAANWAATYGNPQASASPGPDPYAGAQDPYLAPVLERLNRVEEIEANNLFNQQFTALRSKQYPLADESEVRNAMLAGTARTIQQAMQASHTRMTALREKWIADHSAANTERQAAGVEGAGGGAPGGGIDYSKMSTEEFKKRKAAILGY